MKRKRTLVVLLCQAREFSRTLESLETCVLRPMNADLAYFGGEIDPREAEPIRTSCRAVVTEPEPDSWLAAMDRESSDGGGWRLLTQFGPMLMGGIEPQFGVGSGAIIMYWRERLHKRQQDLPFQEYDWVIFTRSDFLWQVPHPNVELLDPDRIYFMNGEQHGGISDRHAIVPAAFVKPFLAIPSPIFHKSQHLTESLAAWRTFPDGLNPERYILFRLEELGLKSRIEFLPYLGFTVRSHDGSTRWSQGRFDQHLGLYVKYPQEQAKSMAAKRLIRNQVFWQHFFRTTHSPTLAVIELLKWQSPLLRSQAFARIRSALERRMRRVLPWKQGA